MACNGIIFIIRLLYIPRSKGPPADTTKGPKVPSGGKPKYRLQEATPARFCPKNPFVTKITFVESHFVPSGSHLANVKIAV